MHCVFLFWIILALQGVSGTQPDFDAKDLNPDKQPELDDGPLIDQFQVPHSFELSAQSQFSPDYIIPVTQSDLSLLSGKRDFYTVLYITSTDPQHQCQPCQTFDQIVRKVASAWFADYSSSNFLFFVSVDIVDRSNADIFKALDIDRIPHIWLIPPSREVNIHQDDEEEHEENEDDDLFQIVRELEDSEDPLAILRQPKFEWKTPDIPFDEQVFEFADFLSQTVGKSIFLRPENQIQRFFKTFAITFSLIILIKKRGPQTFTNHVSKKKIYIGFTLLLLAAFTGGYSFSVMERVPFLARNEHGKIIYVSGGMYYQFGIEVVIIGGTYIAMTLSLASLIHLGNYRVGDDKVIASESQKSILVLLNALAIYLLYSCLTSFMLRKDPGYPYPLAKLF